MEWIRKSILFAVELMSMKAAGKDLSTLNPLSNGAYWTNVDIGQQSMDRTVQKGSGLYQGIEFEYPADGSTLNFDEVKRSQSRPKFDVTWQHNGKRRNSSSSF